MRARSSSAEAEATRSLSNVYKYYVAHEKPDSTRYIDTNAITEERMRFHEEQQARRKAEAERIAREKARAEAGEDGDTETEGEEGEFVAGLAAEEVDPETGEVLGEAVAYAEEPAEEEEPQIPDGFREMAEQMIAEAQQQADMILAEAKEEAGRIKAEAHETGRNSGYAEGRDAAEQELAGERAKLDTLRSSLETEHDEAMKELEPQLLTVILQVFERVFGIQFEDKKEILTHLVTNTILGVEGAREFRIRSSAEDASFLTEQLPLIREKVGSDISIEVIGDPSLSKGQCMIETDSGIFDCGIDTELNGLIKDLKSLAP